MNTQSESVDHGQLTQVNALKYGLDMDILEPRILMSNQVNMEGFDTPNSYTAYKKSGGAPLGTFKDLIPLTNPQEIFNTIIGSVESCCSDKVDLSKVKYKEFNEGAKFAFELPTLRREVKSKMVGDIVQASLMYTGSFDGSSAQKFTGFVHRLWCSNGCTTQEAVKGARKKQTKFAQPRIKTMVYDIINELASLDTYFGKLDQTAKMPILEKDKIAFVSSVLGFDITEPDLNTRKVNILDKINESIAIEIQNTGANMFGLLQGVTRYTSDINRAKDTKLGFLEGTYAKMNEAAHTMAFAHLN